MKILKQHQPGLLALLLLLPLAPLCAQVGNDNPAGVAGIFDFHKKEVEEAEE